MEQQDFILQYIFSQYKGIIEVPQTFLINFKVLISCFLAWKIDISEWNFLYALTRNM